MRRVRIRRWGGQFYASFHCVERKCDNTWKSSYFPTREEAATYAASAPKRGPRARCQQHRTKGAKQCR